MSFNVMSLIYCHLLARGITNILSFPCYACILLWAYKCDAFDAFGASCYHKIFIKQYNMGQCIRVYHKDPTWHYHIEQLCIHVLCLLYIHLKIMIQLKPQIRQAG